MTREQKIEAFDPNDAAAGDQLFGLPFTEEESSIVILPVPWEVTVSYRTGTFKAPKAILEASRQVDLFDHDLPDAWKAGIYMRPVDKNIAGWSKELRKKAEEYLERMSDPKAGKKKINKLRDEINKAGASLRDGIRREMRQLLEQQKIPALLGGDHSTPLGLLYALTEVYNEFGILQIDAHCDLRDTYEGFEFSHASIMFNALKIPQMSRLVQVGIRDCGEQEVNTIHQSGGRIRTFFDTDMKRSMNEGETWKEICDHIVHQLPRFVYVSFDIDGLDPKLCPNTGTPVPGGLQFEQAVYLLQRVVHSGRKIISFDLNEVAPGGDEWDANVGARLLYKLCNLMLLSHRMFKEVEPDDETELPTNDEEIIVKRGVREDMEIDKEIGD